ncbi:hypothetical protein DN820_01800 [Stutzerimonas nosocomialis]|uniref:DUF7210 domain-containing protein n=1 Tax=Stutzerimonas nosocomialis TaxID=1056496 RepID=A0A5R9QII8_9GAMM|nr:hypothetical protein [Stutzerimonas nosocomialis]TLX65071.1 hypothetical protein DN820_01800 [Stutzerimonas nosocomialis]
MSTAKTSAAPQPELVEVVLDKPHTHAGKPCKKGDTIKVTADQKAWLNRRGVIGQQKEANNG